LGDGAVFELMLFQKLWTQREAIDLLRHCSALTLFCREAMFCGWRHMNFPKQPLSSFHLLALKGFLADVQTWPDSSQCDAVND